MGKEFKVYLLALTLTVFVLLGALLGPAYAVTSTWISSPAATLTNSAFTTLTTPINMHDNNNATSGYFAWGETATGYLEFKDYPPAASPTNYPILSVEFGMHYRIDSGCTDDGFTLKYYVGTAGPRTLQARISPTGGVAEVSTAWAAGTEPTDNLWTWTDIDNARFRIETDWGANGKADKVAGKYLNFVIWEVWLRVTVDKTPVTGSAKLYVDPAYTAEKTPTSTFTVDVDVTNVTNIWGFGFFLFYKTSVLTATGYLSYSNFPFEQSAAINDTAGFVYVSFSMPYGEAIGLSGRMQLIKITFSVDAAGGSILELRDSTLTDPSANSITHTTQNGQYGPAVPEFPLGMAIELALIAPIVYIWWKRKARMPNKTL